MGCPRLVLKEFARFHTQGVGQLADGVWMRSRDAPLIGRDLVPVYPAMVGEVADQP
jgi:hypothetical protein